MHGSAHPFVMMLHVPEREGAPAAWLFSITGCLGMTGLSATGVGLTINNLKSLDAKVGIVWPALVRRALREATAERARDVILESPLGSGHHYLVADATRAFGIETSGTREKVVYDGSAPCYVHTNHCLDAEMAEVHTVGTDSTTHLRFDLLTKSASERPIESRADLWSRLGAHDGYPKSVCTHMATPDAPHKMRTCGGVAMDLAKKDLWAAPGCLHHARPHVFGF
jgi:isopenicillin-N N-acyltransferase-like protein